jgi:sugar lactone lactonase YvrE
MNFDVIVLASLKAIGVVRRWGVSGLLLPGLAIVMSGCGVGTVESGTPPGTLVGGMQGVIHGGQNPVGLSVVSLMAVGTSGYGTTPTALSTTTSAPVTGLFTLPSHTCPTPDRLVYIEAVGGDSGTGVNTAIDLAAVLGPCSTVTADTVVNVDEVTTVAAAYALAPFATLSTLAGLGIGSSATNITGLNNAAGPANNLVDFTTGLARNTADVSGMVLPTPLINTLADILAACVNTGSKTSDNCAYLTANTTANGFVPTDTFEAAISIAQNPGANVANLLTLSSGMAPFQPTISAMTPPADFSVAIGYNGSGIATYGAIDVAIDATGNAWITTFHTTPTETGLIEIAPDGTYLSGAAGFGTAVLGQSVGVSIDQSGIVWVGNNQDNRLNSFNAAGTLVGTYTGISAPNGQDIDANGDIWTSAGGNGDTLQELVKGTGGTYTLGTTYTSATLFGTEICITPTVLWATFVGEDDEDSTVTRLDLGTKAQTVITPDPGGGVALSGCALDHAGNLYLPDFDVEAIDVYTPAGVSKGVWSVSQPNAAGQYGYPQDAAFDGLGNLFSSTNVYDSASFGEVLVPGTLVEFNGSGTEISPNYGYAPTTGVANAGDTGLIGLTPVEPVVPGGLAVDGSGNVWISGLNEGSGLPNYVTEVIGIAAPVVTPKAVALTNGVVATRP